MRPSADCCSWVLTPSSVIYLMLSLLDCTDQCPAKNNGAGLTIDVHARQDIHDRDTALEHGCGHQQVSHHRKYEEDLQQPHTRLNTRCCCLAESVAIFCLPVMSVKKMRQAPLPEILQTGSLGMLEPAIALALGR